MTPEDLVSKAIEIATLAHLGQKRKYSGEAYIHHPYRIALGFPNDPTLQAIGWLHDVVEDTSVGLEDLRKEGFPSEVVEAVDALTRRIGETYFDYLMRLRINSAALAIKLADLRDNLSDAPEGTLKDKHRLAQYILEKDL